MASDVDQTYRYLRPSEVRFGQGRTDVVLATSGGSTSRGRSEHPVFFDGFLGHSEQTAAALLSVAKVARTRFYTPPGMLAAILRAADPVVTSNGDRLRFESLPAGCTPGSTCCRCPRRSRARHGDHQRRLQPADAGGAGTRRRDRPAAPGGGRGRRGHHPGRVRDGEEGLSPERWLKGFAEVQLAASRMRPVAEVSAAEARRFVRALPPGTGSRTRPMWAVPTGRALRLTTRPSADGAGVSGPERLRPLEPPLRFARSLRAYAPPYDPSAPAAASLWELVLDDARSVLASARTPRAGRRAACSGTSDEQAALDAEPLSVLLAFEPRIDVLRLAAGAGIAEQRVSSALGHLGAAGRVGYDAAEQAFFHRELPFDAARLEAMHPRLRAARALVDAGAVRVAGTRPTSRARTPSTSYAVIPKAAAARAPGTASTRPAGARASTSSPSSWRGGLPSEPPASLGPGSAPRGSCRAGGRVIVSEQRCVSRNELQHAQQDPECPPASPARTRYEVLPTASIEGIVVEHLPPGSRSRSPRRRPRASPPPST